MKTKTLFLLAIASIMFISSLDASPLPIQRMAALKHCSQDRRGKIARIKAHKMRHHNMRHHIVGRPFRKNMRRPRLGVSVIL
jgi:hypothetical protein